MLIVKLGGSFITYKSVQSKIPLGEVEIGRRYPIKKNVLVMSGKALRDHMEEGLIIVHGGGTHGHRTVRRWREGATRMRPAMMPWEVRLRMDQLSMNIASALGEARLPVYPIDPPDVVQASNGRIVTMDPGPIVRVLDRGMVPMLRGDLVPDSETGWSVVSGDDLMVRLCELSLDAQIPRVDRVVMCMDVPGIYDPGKNDRSVSIPAIGPEDLHSLWDRLKGTGSGWDASGGLMKKLKCAHMISARNIPVDLIGGRPDVLGRYLSGEMVGTRILPFDGGPDCISGRCRDEEDAS